MSRPNNRSHLVDASGRWHEGCILGFMPTDDLEQPSSFMADLFAEGQQSSMCVICLPAVCWENSQLALSAIADWNIRQIANRGQGMPEDHGNLV